MKESKEETQNLVSTRNKLLWLLLISLGAITYLTGYYSVSAYQTRNQVLDECPRDICSSYLQYKSGPFDIKTNPVIAIEIKNLKMNNQFITLEAFPVVAGKRNEDINLQVEVSSFAVDKNQKVIQVLTKKDHATVTYTPLEEGQKDYIPQPLARNGHVEHDNYIFVVRIINGEKLQEQQVHNLRLAFITLNTAYVHNLAYFKWFLFTIALVSWFLYRNKIAKFPKGYASIEQKKVGQLAFVLLLITQPFATYFSFGQTSSYEIFNVLLMATQGALLISYWFNLLERITAGSNGVSSTMKFAINFFAAIHLVVFAVISWILAQEQEGNPFLNASSQGLTLYKYYSYAFIGIVSVWSLIGLVKSLGKLRELDWRDSSALLFSFYYILCFMVFMFTGSLQVEGSKGARVVLFFGITTLYTVLLQLLHAPFEYEVEDAEKRRKYDNPEARNQYDDLDMSGDASKKDNIQLRNADQIGYKVSDDNTESEDVEV